jgi:hypothetical protein
VRRSGFRGDPATAVLASERQHDHDVRVTLRIDGKRLLSSLKFGAITTVGLVAIGYGCSTAVTGDAETKPPAGVERYLPTPGEMIFRQTQIGADLATGYRGMLIVDGQTIPTYDLSPNNCSPNTQAFSGVDAVFDSGQNTVMFQPKAGSTMEKFAPGKHRATIRFWKICEDPATARTASWTFSVS